MNEKDQYKNRIELLQGTLEMLILQTLQRQRWVQSEWKQSESKQKARYYRITAKGKKQLASDLDRWQQIVEAIGSVMYVKAEESAS